MDSMSIKKIFFVGGLVVVSVTSSFADADIEKGKTIYNGLGACMGCHGTSGKGDGPAGAAINPKPRDLTTGVYSLDTDKDGKTGTETDLLNVITNGAAPYGGSPMMVGRKDIPEGDRKAVVKYILSMKK